jgi:hypothetical protein
MSINGFTFESDDVFASFLNDEPSVKSKAKSKAKSAAKRGGSGLFPASVFVRRGAKVRELAGGGWLVDFVRGKFVSSSVDERYILRILNDFSSELVDPGDVQWTVEEVQNGKFLIKRVA